MAFYNGLTRSLATVGCRPGSVPAGSEVKLAVDLPSAVAALAVVQGVQGVEAALQDL